jgi:predicted signal transduction protein with EAL and GGDEF domain
MGGDEFVIVLRNVTGSENAALVARGIVDSLSRPFLLEDRRVFLTVSIGIALYPLDGRDTDELIRKADTAMYHAKGQGKNRYQFFTAAMNRRAHERMALQTDLRRALERNEFVVHYQPKICIDSGEVTGVEALLRWQKPEDGLVPPASFIPLAEETGLIVPIGEKVLRLACTQAKDWQAEGVPHLPVAVNLSAVQLSEEGLAGTVQRILTETGLDPAGLELEITESAVMKESEKAIAMLKAMREMGIRITMDDFGTGYSSLSYLKRFPISRLKIDRSFIAEVLSNSDDAEIIRAIIAMAHRMRMKVVAEGVETAEQLEFLREEGCDEAQGYYFARPMPAAEFSRWFQARRKP